MIKAVDGCRLTIDQPLEFGHYFSENQRGEVANLSRNVVIESADRAARGHTMYHRHSTGSIAYAEFRHLGKDGNSGNTASTSTGSATRCAALGHRRLDLGQRQPVDHDPRNQHLVVRECVGYRGVGHGFFLEDGTEVENILDRNLAVQACQGKPLPGQVFPLDRNEGAGFWWANSQNAFIRNVAVECDGYGFRFDAPESPESAVMLPVRGPDGQRTKVDIRTLPFLRFDGNEAHTQRRYGLNLGGAAGDEVRPIVGGKGPDSRHPFAIRDFRVWDTRWAITPATPRRADRWHRDRALRLRILARSV